MPQLELKGASPQEHYSDGESENTLLDLFKSSADFNTAIETMLASDPSWPIRYHLSPLRANLLSWYPFNPDGTVLEIGAGCGALTGLLCEKLRSVTAVELTELRAQIIFHRHKDRENLRIIAGNLTRLRLEEKFDYVICVGVLEYAERYGSSNSPYLDFLRLVGKHLAPNGTLILAIENRLGIKYWAGVREDHTARLFDSIENYPSNPGVRTFGRTELAVLLKNAGFDSHRFYYPMPDYKLPLEIFSDEYQPSITHAVRPGLLPAVDWSAAREYIFDERLALDSVIGNGLFQHFANSFLVFAQRNSQK